MSQKGSSIVSSDNPEVKYKKALMEIQKIHNANKVLKSQSEEMKAQYQRQLDELGHSHEIIQKQNQTIKGEKAELEKFLEELQVSNTELRKQYNNLEREMAYLNDVLAQQNRQVRKLQAFKNEKGFSELIKSYEDRELTFRKEISRQEDLLKSVKTSCETLQNDLAQERRQRYKLQDLNNSLRMEITKYKELNNGLLNKNESIISNLLSRTSEGRQKYRQAETIISEIGRQLEIVKSTRLQNQQIQKNTVSLDSYETLLHQKTKAQGEIQRLREKLQNNQSKQRQMYEIEQKMKRAVLRAQQLHEQCNMLKSKLVVIETKDLMEGSEDIGLKEFEQRVLVNLGQNDPLPAIKNSSDSSHFQLMKAYIVDLKEKLAKAQIQKKQFEKKYRSLKEKIGQKAEKAVGLEQQNKLLKGKLEGFQRLTQRLQFELQRNMQVHEEQMGKMKNITNSILNRKAEETKVANAYVRAQLDLQLDKFERTQKGLREEIETLKLQLSTEKIKSADIQNKSQQANEFLLIYKKKLQDLEKQANQLQETNNTLSQNGLRFEQLYREEKVKSEALLGQKQALTLKISQISEETDKNIIVQNSFQQKELNYEAQIRKLKLEINQAKNEVTQLQNSLKNVNKLQNSGISAPLGQENSYYQSLQQNYQQQKQRSKRLESQLANLKIRVERASTQIQRNIFLEDSLSAKEDEINDLRRKIITFQKQIGVLETEMREVRNQYQNARKEASTLKSKLLDSGQDIRRTYELKDVESKRSSQKINEDLATVIAQLRQEKRTSSRQLTELQNLRNQLRRSEQVTELLRKKESALSEEYSQLKNSYQNLSDQSERLKSDIKSKISTIEAMNAQMNGVQERYYKLTQDNTQIRLKVQATQSDYSDLKRELGGLKVYITELEQYANRKPGGSSWQQERDKENLGNFVQKVKKLIRVNEISQGNAVDYRSNNYKAEYTGSTPLPDYLKPYLDQNSSNAPKIGVSEQSSPFTLNYDSYGGGAEGGFTSSYKYGNY